jgi:hypothetical protein
VGDREIEATKRALERVKQKYGASPEAAKTFLQKMGFLTKQGKVSRPYSSGKSSAKPRGQKNRDGKAA